MMKLFILRWWQHQNKVWIIVSSIFILSACQGRSIPDFMIDTWVTDKLQYEKCYLKITPLRIIFGDPGQNGYECDITKVSTVKKDQTVMVTIDYVTRRNEPFTVELLYSSKDGGHLSFKNRPGVIWKRLKIEIL